MKELILKRKDGKVFNGEIKVLNEGHIDQIMNLQKEIINGLEIRELYADSSKESFIECIKNKGKILGCFVNNELIAMGVYIKYKYDHENYGYDLGLEGEDLLKVGQIESTIVREDYRGNKLQKIICDLIEVLAQKDNLKIIGATVSPINKYSLNTFINSGYTIEDEKIKYGGYRRYILKKEI